MADQALTASAAPTRPRGEDSSFRLLATHIRPHRWTILIGGLITFLGGVAGLAEPLVAKVVIDSLSSGGGLLGPIALLTGLVVVGAGVGALGSYLLTRTAENVVLTARRRLVGQLMHLRVAEVDRLKPGGLIARLTSDTTLLRGMSTTGLVSGVNGVLLTAGSIVLMGFMDPVLLLVTLAVLGVLGGTAAVLLPRIGKATESAQAAVAGIGTTLERALGAFRTVKASGAERREIAAGEDAATDAWRSGVRAARWDAVIAVIGGLAVQVSFLAVLGVGGARVASGAIELSSLIAFLLFLFYLMAPISNIVEAATQFQIGMAAIRRIREVGQLDTEAAAPAAVALIDSKPGRETAPASISFDRVSFRYSSDGPAIHRDLTFTLPAGGMTAVVGPSGAGKTTVFSLIERFYEASAGSVRVDGTDVADWPLPELRAAISYVEQDAPVLAGTIRDNLVYAAPDVTDEEVTAVLDRTRLRSMVARLPDGIDTRVGHRGLTLSGGERQRIAIARALLRRPRVLLLDEITSQLDAVNELALREVVTEAARTTTVLVIAHRLSTVTGADRVLLLDRGAVRALGSHADLLTRDDLYRELATTQALEAGGLAS